MKVTISVLVKNILHSQQFLPHSPRTFVILTRCLCLSEHPCRRLSTLKNGALNKRDKVVNVLVFID